MCYASNHTDFYVGPAIPTEFGGEQSFPLDVFEGVCYRVEAFSTTTTTTQTTAAIASTGACAVCLVPGSEVGEILGGDAVRDSIDSTSDFLTVFDKIANDTVRTVQSGTDETQTRQAIQNLTLVAQYVVTGSTGFSSMEKLMVIDDLLNTSAGVGFVSNGSGSFANSSTASMLFGIRSSIDLMVMAYDSDLDAADGATDSIVLRQFTSGSNSNIYGFARAFRKPADGGTTALTTFPDGAMASDIVFVVPLSVFESDVGECMRRYANEGLRNTRLCIASDAYE